jgi:Ca2+/Na+ antiporter
MYYKVIYDEMIQNEKGKRARSKGMSTHKVWIRKQTWFWLVTTIISLFFLITNIVPFSLVLRFLFIVLLLYIVSFYLMQSTSQRKRVTTIRVIKNVDSSKNSFFFPSFFLFFLLHTINANQHLLSFATNDKRPYMHELPWRSLDVWSLFLFLIPHTFLMTVRR